MFNLKKEYYSKDKILNCAFVLTGFLMGRAVLFGSINGLGLGYLTCFAFGGNIFYAVAAAVTAGLFTVKRTMDISEYVIGIVLLCLFHFLGREKVRDDRKYFFGALSLLSGALLTAAFTGNFVYYCIIGSLETAFSAVTGYIIDKGINVIRAAEQKEYITGDEMLSLFILAAAVIIGGGDLSVFGFSPSVALAVTVIFIAGARGGCVTGLACGACMGVMLSFADIYPVGIVPAMAVSGMTGAMLGGIKKALMPVGFVTALAPMAVYYRLELLTPGGVAAVLAAGVINMYLPDKLYLHFYNTINTGFGQSNMYGEEIKAIACRKIKRLSECFADLGTHIPAAAVQEGENVKFEIFDQCTANVCSRCSRQSECWEGNYSTTYKNLYSLVSKWVDKGNVDLKNLPNYFLASCIRYREWLLWAKNAVDEKRYKALIAEEKSGYRQLLYLYTQNLADRIGAIAEEIENETNIDRELSEKIYKRIAVFGVRGAVVSMGERGIKLRIALPNTCSDEILEAKIMPVVREILNVNLIKGEESTDCVQKSITLVREPPLRVSAYGCSKPKAKDEISGDSFIFTDLDDGKYLLALADGMGSGRLAGRESAAAVEMYEDFTAVGFKREASLELINSLVSAREDSFSTLDICTLDRYSGKAEFVKIGAVSTLIAGKRGIEVLKSNTLPVGILDSVDAKVYEKRLEKGDVILMMTDGITELFKSEDKKAELMKILRERKNATAEGLAKNIMNTALEAAEACSRDDMTVLAANVY